MLRQRGLTPRAPHRTFATPDHYVPTDSRDLATIADPEKRAMAQTLADANRRAPASRISASTIRARASCM